MHSTRIDSATSHHPARSGNGNENADAQHLLTLIGKGDEAAFTKLHKAWSRKLYAYVLRQVDNAQQAEEIVSDTLHDVWRAPSTFRGDAQFSTWLIGIARNKVRMSWRTRMRDVAHDHDDLDDVADEIASDDEGAFDRLASAQRREGVARCIDTLPDEQRECVQLVFFEELSLGEVAARQGVPEGTVKTRLFHARRKLEAGLRAMLTHEGEALVAIAR
jgi:RNA polymerase sigma-70 factor, ECF subfamily